MEIVQFSPEKFALAKQERKKIKIFRKFSSIDPETGFLIFLTTAPLTVLFVWPTILVGTQCPIISVSFLEKSEPSRQINQDRITHNTQQNLGKLFLHYVDAVKILSHLSPSGKTIGISEKHFICANLTQQLFESDSLNLNCFFLANRRQQHCQFGVNFERNSRLFSFS